MTAGSIAVPTIMPLRFPLLVKTKTNIDSNTLIELRSETPGTRIFYTVDNTRPNPEKKLGEQTTMLYKQPFMLRAGKRCIKAMAVTRDGRESNVVTKVFTVEYVHPNDEVDDKSSDDNESSFQRELSRGTKFSTQMMTANVMSGRGPMRGEAWGPLSNPLSNPPSRPSTGINRGRRMSELNLSRNSRSSSPSRMNDLIRCVHCDHLRPKKPDCRFCPECGKPVPVDPNAENIEPGAMGMCIKCQSYIPLNQEKCIVCEEPIASRPRHVTTVRMKEGIICGACGSNNPPNLTHCASCEHRFPAAIHSGENAPPLPRLDAQLVRCPACTRINNPDARFCDWCGEKPIPEEFPITCSLCKHNNKPYSKFCAHCGGQFEAPERLDPRNSQLGDERINSYAFQDLPMWKSIPMPSLPTTTQTGTRVIRTTRRPTREAQCQTVGLFYPGAKKLTQEQEILQELRQVEVRMRDKQPPLSAISPGRGFWRKQLDHICGHLRGYTTNNVEFRSVIGEPRLGKILGTTIDEGDEELILGVTFALRSHDEFGRNQGLHRDMYKYNKKQVAFGSTLKEDELNNLPQKKNKKKKKKSATLIREEKMNPEDRLLVKELGPRGDGRPDEVKTLIEEGADPNCLDAEKRAPLLIAIAHERRNCLKTLIHGGAEVNRRSGSQHNTPLHQAVKLGPDGKDIVKLLLQNGAKTDIKNDKGLSPYDVAVRSDYNSIVAMFNEPNHKPIRRKKKKIEESSSSDDTDDTDDLF